MKDDVCATPLLSDDQVARVGGIYVAAPVDAMSHIPTTVHSVAGEGDVVGQIPTVHPVAGDGAWRGSVMPTAPVEASLYTAEPLKPPLVRCVHCGTTFERGDTSDSCRRHTGKYRRPGTMAVMLERIGWTCCDAAEEDATPCFVGSHVEDPRETQLRHMFPLRETPLEEVPPADEEGPEGSTIRHRQVPSAPTGTGILHRIKGTETLEGLSLRYGVSVTAITNANRGVGNPSTILARKFVKIPTSEVDTDGSMQAYQENYEQDEEEQTMTASECLVALRRAAGGKLGEDEAAAYLALADGDVEAAIAEYSADQKWGAEQPEKHFQQWLGTEQKEQIVEPEDSSRSGLLCCFPK